MEYAKHLRCGIRVVAVAFATVFVFLASASIGNASDPHRGFYMAMWHMPQERDVDLAFFEPTAPSDHQPASRSILDFENMFTSFENTAEAFEDALRSGHYDWSRIAAVMIDEPYWTQLGNPLYGHSPGDKLPSTVAQDWTLPCGGSSGMNDPRYPYLIETATRIDNLAKAVKKFSPTTRVWMNFSEPETQWILATAQSAGVCGSLKLLRNGIDVMSLDKYRVPFSEIAPYYDTLRQYFPTLKFGLVPGLSFTIPSGDIASDPTVPKTWLQQFFDYANTTNANAGCTVDVRNAAINSTDNCVIWLVAGWHGSTTSTHYVVDAGFAGGKEQAFFYCGEVYDPNPTAACSSVSPIRDAWRAQLGTPVGKRKAALLSIFDYGIK